jgi:uncharacterized membrane protein
MNRKVITALAFTLVSLSPLLYLFVIWPDLPDVVPMHYDVSFKPNGFGAKTDLWLITGIFSGISILIYFLLTNLDRIDPKRVNQSESPLFHTLSGGLVLFLTGLNFLILSGIGNPGLLAKGLVPWIGLMFSFLGYCMRNIKPNFFAGIRVPWTLSNDENWRLTHLLAGKLWLAGGLIIALLALVTSPQTSMVVLIGVIIILTIIPVGYSFILYKKEQKTAGRENS